MTLRIAHDICSICIRRSSISLRCLALFGLLLCKGRSVRIVENGDIKKSYQNWYDWERCFVDVLFVSRILDHTIRKISVVLLELSNRNALVVVQELELALSWFLERYFSDLLDYPSIALDLSVWVEETVELHSFDDFRTIHIFFAVVSLSWEFHIVSSVVLSLFLATVHTAGVFSALLSSWVVVPLQELVLHAPRASFSECVDSSLEMKVSRLDSLLHVHACPESF